MDGCAVDSDKWAISLGTPLKPVFTRQLEKNEDEEELSTTPTSAESRIPATTACPPAPKKRRQASSRSCHYGAGVREFFNPPDLEAIFMRRVEGAQLNWYH